MKTKILAIFAALLMSIGLLAAAIYVPATASWVMQPLMQRFAPPEETGLPAAEYAPVVDMITGYLRGGNHAFQHVFTMDGAEYAAFNQKEQHHMADVQGLFWMCRFVIWLCGGVVILGGLSARRKIPWRTFRLTLLVVLAVVTVIVVLAAIDFNSLFILFHKVAFTNDLWLLDPRTDMLIRLMPLEFFISYAAIIGCCWLLGMAALLAGCTVLINKQKRAEGE